MFVGCSVECRLGFIGGSIDVHRIIDGCVLDFLSMFVGSIDARWMFCEVSLDVR